MGILYHHYKMSVRNVIAIICSDPHITPWTALIILAVYRAQAIPSRLQNAYNAYSTYVGV